MITLQASVSKGWLYNEKGFSFPESYYFDSLFRLHQDREINEYLQKRFPDLPIYNMESNLVQEKYYQPDQALICGL